MCVCFVSCAPARLAVSLSLCLSVLLSRYLAVLLSCCLAVSLSPGQGGIHTTDHCFWFMATLTQRGLVCGHAVKCVCVCVCVYLCVLSSSVCVCVCVCGCVCSE